MNNPNTEPADREIFANHTEPAAYEDETPGRDTAAESAKPGKTPSILAIASVLIGIALNTVYVVIELLMQSTAKWDLYTFSQYQEAMGRGVISCAVISILAYVVLFITRKAKYTLFFPGLLIALGLIFMYIANAESKQAVTFKVPTEMRGFTDDEWGEKDVCYDNISDTYFIYGYDDYGHYVYEDLGSNPDPDKIRAVNPKYVSDDPILTGTMPWAISLIIPAAIMLGCMAIFAGRYYRATLFVNAAAGVGASVITFRIFGKAMTLVKCAPFIGLNCAWYAAAVILYVTAFKELNSKPKPKKTGFEREAEEGTEATATEPGDTQFAAAGPVYTSADDSMFAPPGDGASASAGDAMFAPPGDEVSVPPGDGDSQFAPPADRG
ncbi:MAG: hypothetical protein IKX20_06490 [Paludibacteraceae bacterium]|nr:hypothetical protein [Paludibacteraceae bacterium]